MILVEIDGDYGDDDGGVRISDEHGEIVMWDSQEWIDEPSLVFVIATAVRDSYVYGATWLREKVGNPISGPRFCQSHVSCPDHDGALYWCGRFLNHVGWHVGGYESIVTSSRPSLHRWNSTGRIEHI